MKKNVKFLSLILLLFITLTAICPVFAYDDEDFTVDIRIEGATETILDMKNFQVEDGISALNAVVAAMDLSGTQYTVLESDYGKYISCIGSDTEGMYGGYDGWMYAVNSQAPAVSASDYILANKDSLVFYFGSFDTYLPTVSASYESETDSVILNVSAEYYDWYSSENVTLPVPNAKITFAGKEYITDTDGNTAIPADIILFSDTTFCTISGNRENNYPIIVRQNYEISKNIITENNEVTYNDETVLQQTETDIAKKNDTDTALTAALDNIAAKTELNEFEIIALAINNAKDISVLRNNVAEKIKASGGIFKKSTDISKLIMACVTVGLDPHKTDYNLCRILSDFENIEKQGVNASIFALIAQKMSGDIINTKFIQNILNAQNEDGSIPLIPGNHGDVDITAMAVYALCDFSQDVSVENAIKKAIGFLSNAQNENGGYYYNSEECSETVSQVITALSALGISADNPDFTKSGKTLTDALMSFYDDGAFSHIRGGGKNDMATFQAILALSAAKEMQNIYPASRYNDIFKSHWAYDYVQKLTDSGILAGNNDGSFLPEQYIKREEFIKMTVCAFANDAPESNVSFSDVDASAWYKPYIAKAISQELTNGFSDGTFGVGKLITREEAATILCRAAKFTYNGDDALTFKDSDEISDFAKDAVLTLVSQEVINGMSDGCFAPKENMTKAQAAVCIGKLIDIIGE